MRGSCLTLISSVVVLSMLGGCGAILNGRYQDLQITSTPPGLTVQVDDQKCTTPCVLSNISKRREIVTVLLKDGEADVKINRKVTAWIIPDILFSGFVFVLMDKVSGGLYELKPLNINLAEQENITYRFRAGTDLYPHQTPVSAPTSTAH